MSQQLDKIKLDYVKDDHKNESDMKKSDCNQESDNEDNSHSGKDVEMDDKSQEAESSVNMETRRTRRKIKKPEYLANNYHLEDNKDNKQPQSSVKVVDRKKSQSEEKKSAVVTRKSIKIIKNEGNSVKSKAPKHDNGPKESNILPKTSMHLSYHLRV